MYADEMAVIFNVYVYILTNSMQVHISVAPFTNMV